jgi:hypothetical protein
MDHRHQFKIAAIKARLEFCEAERRELLTLVTTSKVNLAKAGERMDRIQRELRFLAHDLEVQEKLLASEE